MEIKVTQVLTRAYRTITIKIDDSKIEDVKKLKDKCSEDGWFCDWEFFDQLKYIEGCGYQIGDVDSFDDNEFVCIELEEKLKNL